jgi:O-antigen ligase
MRPAAVLATPTANAWPWTDGILAGAVTVVLLAWGPLPAAVLAGMLIVQRFRPADFLTAFLLVVVGASFVDYTQGQLTPQLRFLSVGLLFVLACYALGSARPVLRVPRTELTVPLSLYLGLIGVNFIRGVLVGNSLRYAGLELLSGLGLACAFLVANRRPRRDDLREILLWLGVLGLGHLALGIWKFTLFGVRTGQLSFTPVPGLLAILFFNLALRHRGRAGLLWILAMTPMVVHQFLSFTRGYWLALAVAFAFSCVVHGGRSTGWRERWGRVAMVCAFAIGACVIATGVGGWMLGLEDVGVQALSRLQSATSTEFTYESGSNVVRLVEYAQVLEHIQRSPWYGHGLGYAFVVREPFRLELLEQWATHNNYLLVWLKHGVVGLAVFCWTLLSAVRMSLRGRRDPDSLRAGFCAGTSAATLYVIVYCLVHFPLGEINTTFTLALLWGVVAGLTARGHEAIVWRAPERAPGPGGSA